MANVVDEKNAEKNDATIKTIERSLEERIEKKEEQILKMEATVFQVANYYFVFQGVILTAIIKGSSSWLNCKFFWLPFFLSAIGAVLNFGTLVVVVEKYKESLDQLDENTLILFQKLYPNSFETKHEKHKKMKARRHWIMVTSLVLFLIFASLNLLATWIIPCLS